MVERTQEALGVWLVTRLTGEQAKVEWRKNLEAAWRQLLAQKLSVLVPKAEIEALLTAELCNEKRLEGALTSYVRAVVVPGVEEMRADRAKVARWVPAEARAQISALVAEKGMVHPDWIRSIFREPAIEAIVSDTLYRALIDFSTIVPRLLQNLPLGGFAKIGGIGTRLVEEVEKRLEPEIRRFLDKGTRKALDGATKFSIDHLDDKLSIEFRKNMVGFVLDQEARFHVYALTDERLAQVEEIARKIAVHVAKSAETKTRIHAAIEKIATRDGEKTFAEIIAELGGDPTPPFDQWADVAFPIVVQVLKTPEISAFLGALALEMMEQVEPAKS
jgi:hypothetical protein